MQISHNYPYERGKSFINDFNYSSNFELLFDSFILRINLDSDDLKIEDLYSTLYPDDGYVDVWEFWWIFGK